MGLVRRFGGAMVLLLSTAGIVGCIAVGFGMGSFGQNASERVQNISARLEVGLQRASAANQHVQRAVGQARAGVAEVGKESGNLSKGGEKGRRAARTLRALIQRQVGPRISDVRGRLATWSDTAVAVSSLLQSFQELPSGRVGRLKPDQLERWGEESRQLSTTLRRLEAVVGDGKKGADRREVMAATSKVDLVLQRCQAKMDAWQSNLNGAREEVQRLEAQILGWLTVAGIAVPLLCVWVALAQISLFAHALPWFRGRSKGTPDAPGPPRGRQPEQPAKGGVQGPVVGESVAQVRPPQ